MSTEQKEREFSLEEKQEITFQKLYDVRQMMANRFAMCNLNDKWSDDFKLNTLSSVYESYKTDIIEMPFEIDITLLTTKQLEDLGFSCWSEETGLMLVPICLVSFIGSVMLTDIEGGTVKANELKNFVMKMGCIGYGIVPKDFKPDENKGHMIPDGLRDN